MSKYPDSAPDPQRAAISALMDGDGSASEEACRAWCGDAAARADWHIYHVIGDVMRSDEHRVDGVRDARFLAAVRARLATEPVVLAPTPAAVPPLRRERSARRWMAPAAVAAGFVAVAGVLMVTRVSVPEGEATSLTARSAAPAGSVLPATVASTAGAASQASGSAPMIRSAELDRYLDAHRQYANGAMQVVPGGAVRNAAATAPGR